MQYRMLLFATLISTSLYSSQVKQSCAANEIDHSLSNKLLHAVACDDLATITEILQGAEIFDIEAPDIFGNTALMHAAHWGRAEVLQQLLDAHAEINAQSSSGWTALMQAVFWKHEGIVQKLLSVGANLALVNDDGKTAYDLAQNKPEIQQVFEAFEKTSSDQYDEQKGEYATEVHILPQVNHYEL